MYSIQFETYRFRTPTRSKSHSPATTTRSNRGFELSQRVRLSKIVIRKPAPPIALSPAQSKLERSCR